MTQPDSGSIDVAFFEEKATMYQRLLERKKLSLRFPQPIEKNYQKNLSQAFIAENLTMLIIGIICYALFAVVDYFIYPQAFLPTNLLRFGVLVVLCALLYVSIKHKTTLHILGVTTICLTLVGLQIIIGSSFYETPINLAYIAGILPLFVYILSILRYSFIHTLITTLILLCAYTVIVAGYSWEVPNTPLLSDYIGRVAPAYIVFLSAISVIGIFMSYSTERIRRINWLHAQVAEVESAQLGFLSHELQQISVTDSLTGLKNRRFFDTSLHEQWDVCAEFMYPLTLIMVDVDWFKPYNDNYGHQKGDSCLQNIAKVMCEHVGNRGVLTRYGGEEFFVMLPNMGLKTAIEFADSLRLAVYNKNFTHAYSPLKRCTISLGVGVSIPRPMSVTEVKDREIAMLLKGIDDALYEAKASGKNQTAIA